MHERCKDWWGRRRAARRERATQKLTRESALCAVSEPEASPYCVSLRVAFVSVFVAPDHFLPLRSPPSARRRCVLLFRPVLFRESSSRQERTRTLSSARHDKGELCTILRDPMHSYRAFSLSLSFHKAGEGKIAVYELAHSSSPHSAFERSTLQSDWWMVSRFATFLSCGILLVYSKLEILRFPTMLHVFHGQCFLLSG